jgi:hypothetical protein
MSSAALFVRQYGHYIKNLLTVKSLIMHKVFIFSWSGPFSTGFCGHFPVFVIVSMAGSRPIFFDAVSYVLHQLQY